MTAIPKRKKIVYFNYLYDIWGISIGSTVKGIELMQALSQLGYKVKIFWRNRQPEGPKKDQTNKPAFRERLKKRLDKYLHEPNQYFNNIRFLIQEAKILREEKPDLLISRLDAYFFSSILLSKFYRIPLLLEVDSPGVYEFSTFHRRYYSQLWLLYLLERLNIRLADQSFTVSRTLRDYFVARGIQKDKMAVITNGASERALAMRNKNNDILEKYSLDDKVVIGFVGSFHYWHGVENLIALIEGVLRAEPEAKFLMVGQGGPMRGALLRFIEENNLQEKIILSGFVPHEDVPKYISVMDIVLAPYPQLDFFYYSPVKIFEYMAAGKAVVASRLGQIAEIISDGEDGFLTTPGDSSEMLEKTLLLIRKPELRKKIGEQAWRKIKNQHTWQKKAEKLSALCEKLLKK